MSDDISTKYARAVELNQQAVELLSGFSPLSGFADPAQLEALEQANRLQMEAATLINEIRAELDTE